MAVVAVCLFVTKLLFLSELSAAGAKQGVRSLLMMRTVYPPNDLPRPSRPEAGLGLVMMMMTDEEEGKWPRAALW